MNDERDALMNRARTVKARYENDLLSRRGVRSVGIGLRQKRGEYTKEVCIVVTVQRKYRLDDLEDDDLLPTELDGVPVDVQEVGDIEINSLPED